MIVESVFSCCNLLLTCGSSIYVLVKHSYAQYSKLMTHITCACAGIAIIGSRSLIVLVYKLFFKEYMVDPALMVLEEERNMSRLNILHEILGTLSMAGLIYSLYSSHGYNTLGICVVAGLSILDTVKLYRTSIEKPEQIEKMRFYESPFRSNNTHDSRYNVLIWAIVSGYFAYSVGNNYAMVANYPLVLTNWAMAPEGFYQGWTIRRTINDYLMATYIMCMTEAIRQATVS